MPTLAGAEDVKDIVPVICPTEPLTTAVHMVFSPALSNAGLHDTEAYVTEVNSCGSCWDTTLLTMVTGGSAGVIVIEADVVDTVVPGLTVVVDADVVEAVEVLVDVDDGVHVSPDGQIVVVVWDVVDWEVLADVVDGLHVNPDGQIVVVVNDVVVRVVDTVVWQFCPVGQIDVVDADCVVVVEGLLVLLVEVDAVDVVDKEVVPAVVVTVAVVVGAVTFPDATVWV